MLNDEEKADMIDVLLAGVKEVLESQDSDAVKIERMKRSERLWTFGGLITIIALAGFILYLLGAPHAPACTQTNVQGVLTSVCNK